MKSFTKDFENLMLSLINNDRQIKPEKSKPQMKDKIYLVFDKTKSSLKIKTFLTKKIKSTKY